MAGTWLISLGTFVKLDDALAQISAEFGEPAKTDPEHTCEITSGGPKAKHSDPEPALFVRSDDAVKAWLREMRDVLNVGREYKITNGPHLDKWMITVADKNGNHRVSEPRWSVTAKVWSEVVL